MTGRALSLVLAPLLLAGCGNASGSYSQYIELVRQSLKGSNTAITLDQAAAIPYATIGYRVDGGRQALLVLATDAGGDLTWTAASRVVLVTRDGRILKSVGLPKDRAALVPPVGRTMPSPAEALKGAFRSSRQADMPAIGAYGVTLSCTTAPRGVEMINILGTAMAMARVDESCASTNPRWSFTDSYWIDRDDGFVWRSVQHLYPDGTVVQTEILRKPE